MSSRKRAVLRPPGVSGKAFISGRCRKRPARGRSTGREPQHAIALVGGEASLDQHVIDMGDQFAGGEPHLMHVERVLVEDHRYQFLGGSRRFAARLGNQPTAVLVMVCMLLDASLQSVERHTMI